MVSAREEQNIDNLSRPEPIDVSAVPSCFQNQKIFKANRFDCIICDFFEACKSAASK